MIDITLASDRSTEFLGLMKFEKILEKSSRKMSKADLKAMKKTPKKERKAETKRKHIIIPLEWDEVIKNNYGDSYFIHFNSFERTVRK